MDENYTGRKTMTTLDDLHDRIQRFEVTSCHSNRSLEAAADDICNMLIILGDLVDTLRTLEARNAQACNTASCLANGIQPD